MTIELTVGPPAHGGHCVARLDNRVIFVRHALPGERVRAQITHEGPRGRFWYASTVEVLTPSPDRVDYRWAPAAPIAMGGGGAGGAELSHVRLAAQRRWKSDVIADLLGRIGGLSAEDIADLIGPDFVEAAPEDDLRGGWHWRTRVQLAVDSAGQAGMRRYRSHEVVPITDLPLAVESFADLDLLSRRWPPGARLEVALASDGPPLVMLDGEPWSPRAGGKGPKRSNVRERVTLPGEAVLVPGGASQAFRVPGAGFWQVHRQAPSVLVAAVLAAVGDVTGARVWDLYSGAGLFTAFLAPLVGPQGRVAAVESDEAAVRAARRAFHDVPQVQLLLGDVSRALGGADLPRPDVVVLDPPRAGAGAEVVTAITAARPRKIVHVSCDPATFARDLRTYHQLGWRVAKLRAFDLYPMTHHVETLAVLTPVVS